MNSFRKLNVYIKAKELVKQVYALIKKFPREEQYALCDQLRRAVISIPSNVAEGSGRQTQKDQAHFYTIAYGSLMEVLSQLDVACDLGYINQNEFDKLEVLIDEEAKMLCGLIAKRQESLGRGNTATGRFCEPTDERTGRSTTPTGRFCEPTGESSCSVASSKLKQ